MEVLWQTDSALTVRQVSNGLGQRELAHTTVMTVLDRLAKKGFARRERDGRAWRYRPAATREAYVAELMLTALDQTGDGVAAVWRPSARCSRSASAARESSQGWSAGSPRWPGGSPPASGLRRTSRR